MFLILLKKELKVFFTSKSNLVFMVLLPILMISIFGIALDDYVQGDYGTFEHGRLLYIAETSSAQRLAEYNRIADKITAATGVVSEQAENAETAKREVESSRAFGAVTITDSGYEYYRSPFNEPEGGKLVRSLFVQLSGADANASSVAVQRITLEMPPFNSKAYYTFAALSFSLLFMGLLVAHSVYDEREWGTLIRVRLSHAGTGMMFTCKIITGLVCGAVQIAVAFLFSTTVFGVQWGDLAHMLILLLLLLAALSSVFGAVIGSIAANKSMCQSAVLMTAMLCGYLGGSITPLYLLENQPVLNVLVNLSPLYWTNRALTALYSGILDEKTAYSAAVLAGLIAVILAVYFLTAGRSGKSMKGAGTV